jgi:tetratricopeptide (TPR) repeat protein
MTRAIVVWVLLYGVIATAAPSLRPKTLRPQDALFDEAMRALTANDFLQARLKFEKVMQLEPKHQEACWRLATLYYRDKEYQKEVALLRGCGHADNGDIKEQLGLALYKAGEVDKAVPLLDEVATKKPHAAAAHLQLAQHWMKSEPCRAADYALAYVKAGSLPDRKVELQGRTLAYFALARCRRWSEAVEQAMVMRRLAPDDAKNSELLAAARVGAGDCDGAIPVYEELAKDPDPHDPANDFNLATCYVKAQRWQEAWKLAQAYQTKKPNDARAQKLLDEIGKHWAP